MCKILQVVQRSYYQWKSGAFADRKQRAKLVEEQITSIHIDLIQKYGSSRMMAELASFSNNISRVSVIKYMNQLIL